LKIENMKYKLIATVFATGLTVVSITGCGNKEASPSPNDTPKPSQPAAADAQPTVTTVVSQVKETTEKVVVNAQQAVQQSASNATDQAQAVVTQATQAVEGMVAGTNQVAQAARTNVQVITTEIKQTVVNFVGGTNVSAMLASTNLSLAAKAALTNGVTQGTNAPAAQAQSLIEKAKSYIADKKYEDALASLKQLSNMQLTPEQQKTVDGLKTQLQPLMSNTTVSNAVSKLGGLLGK
jgi:uncharacterized lipoprotein YehR (DUF1307 family)